MPSVEQIQAKAEVLKQAAAWIEDQATCASGSEVFCHSEFDEALLIAEATKLSKKLFNQAKKLESSLKQSS